MVATIVALILLTITWAALKGSFSLGNIVFGLILAGVILRFSRPVFEGTGRADSGTSSGLPRPIRRSWRVLGLIIVFLGELVESAVEVARYTLQPTLQIKPAIIAYPLDVQTDREITTLANLISLTPGTLSLDVSPDRSLLYVHSISVETEDGQEVIQGIKTTLERHVSRALGPRNGGATTSAS